jgi:hypothetical protein
MNWDELENSRVFSLLGAPEPTEVWSMLDFLERADPDKAMRFTTIIGDSLSLDIAKLDEMDGVDIARDVLKILINQLALGAALPSSS